MDFTVRIASAFMSLFGPLALISVILPSRSTTNVTSVFTDPSPYITEPSKLLTNLFLYELIPPGKAALCSTSSLILLRSTFGASIVAALVPVEGGGGGGV